MSKRTHMLLLVGFLLSGTAWAASDPFVGKWKLNQFKSKLIDEMKVEVAGANKYAFNFGGGFDPEIVVANGTDQPGILGTTLSVSVEGPRTWKVVRKGPRSRTLITAIWKLSEDGKTLSDGFTSSHPDGSTFTVNYVYERKTGSSGFPGTWESVSEKVDSVYEVQIQPYHGDGLSFITPSQGETKSMRFDGKDYPNVGPNITPGSVSAGRRVDERSLEVTDKIRDHVYDTRQIELSPDLKTLTMTVHPVGQSKPNILVFDRE